MNPDSSSVKERYKNALDETAQKLASLDIVCGREVNLKGLRGWIFEQTVRTCLEEELKKREVDVVIKEQVPIGGRVKLDLLFGCVAIEVKAAGFSRDDGVRYSSYRKKVEAMGWHYLYLTLHETYQPYVEIARTCFGYDKAFFLDQEGSWLRFVATVLSI